MIALNFDDENCYNLSCEVQFGIMLCELGFNVTICPYTNESFWRQLASGINDKCPGCVDRNYLQCYAGGAGNNPCNWQFDNVPVYPGLFGQHGSGCNQGDSPAQVEQILEGWKTECGITGAWIWLYDSVEKCIPVSKYADAIKEALG